MGKIENVQEVEFEAEVLQAELPVIVDFWASWCGPCHRQAPILEDLVRKRKDVKVVKVDVDANQQIAAAYGVQSIPTLILFRDGKPAAGRVGVQSLRDLEAMLAESAAAS